MGNYAHNKSSEECYWPITSEESQLYDYYLIHKHIFVSLLSQGISRESFRFPPLELEVPGFAKI